MAARLQHPAVHPKVFQQNFIDRIFLMGQAKIA
jgi:hypothetical protein